MAQKLIPWNTGGGNIVVNYSGSGNDTVTVGSDTDNPSFSPRSQDITVHTTAGASISRVVTITQSGKTVPVGTIYNFAYTGTVQSQELPAGTYKLQVWGAQGGSNPADSTYGITSQAGGKGGYSEGILTLTSPTTLYIFVGGQGGSSGNGGWNCGGGSTGSTTKTSGGTIFLTKMACGGGATDIALVTSTMSYSSRRNNRSSASLLSRFIVAGGGSGGAMGCTRTPVTTTVNGTDLTENRGFIIQDTGRWTTSNNYRYDLIDVTALRGQTWTINVGTVDYCGYSFLAAAPPTTNNAQVSYATGYSTALYTSSSPNTGTVPNNAMYMWVAVTGPSRSYRPSSITFETTTDTLVSQQGYAGGGVNGDGYIGTTLDFRGKQDAAGNAGAFGLGGNQINSTSSYAGAAGGAGWYGGGCNNTTSTTADYVVKQSGGGSGFVNIAANAQYRPTGYTGLELFSGVTYDGNTSFPSTSGSTETGHSGNGYARITRVDPNKIIPLTFEVLSNGNIGWKASSSSYTKTIQYSKNGGSWTNLTSTTSGATISVSTGDIVQFRSSNSAISSSSYYNYFTSTCRFKIKGNIMSLLSATSFEDLNTFGADNIFRYLFYNATGLTDASDLYLPTTTRNGCYSRAFQGCTSLVKGPDLLAATIETYAYYHLFDGCSSLDYVKCLATSGINTSSSTTSWLNGVASGGTFVKASGSSWPSSTSGIPSSWTVQNV